MLLGFEKQTAPLTKAEKILVPVLIDILKDRQGINKAIISEDLCAILQPHTTCFTKPIEVSGARLRKMIRYIRTNGLLIGLVGSKKGYYLTLDPTTIQDYLSSLTGREMAIRRLRIRVERHYRQPPIATEKQVQLTLF
ncbi:MAG TPA: hypothetical protein PK772_08425 [Chitinophagaceae bacterium]|nr:hypothetical protein [Chitinophagaceae bacterium]